MTDDTTRLCWYCRQPGAQNTALTPDEQCDHQWRRRAEGDFSTPWQCRKCKGLKRNL